MRLGRGRFTTRLRTFLVRELVKGIVSVIAPSKRRRSFHKAAATGKARVLAIAGEPPRRPTIRARYCQNGEWCFCSARVILTSVVNTGCLRIRHVSNPKRASCTAENTRRKWSSFKERCPERESRAVLC